jgi:hypothetical protein
MSVPPPLRNRRGRSIVAGVTAALLPVPALARSLTGLYVAERFAIDFVQLDENGRLFDGPVDELSSYDSYGADVLSVSNGRVVATQDGLPDNVPGSFPPNATAATAGGNYVWTPRSRDGSAIVCRWISRW